MHRTLIAFDKRMELFSLHFSPFCSIRMMWKLSEERQQKKKLNSPSLLSERKRALTWRMRSPRRVTSQLLRCRAPRPTSFAFLSSVFQLPTNWNLVECDESLTYFSFFLLFHILSSLCCHKLCASLAFFFAAVCRVQFAFFAHTEPLVRARQTQVCARRWWKSIIARLEKKEKKDRIIFQCWTEIRVEENRLRNCFGFSYENARARGEKLCKQ